MNRLKETQVERLLQEAAGWEPEAQMPENLVRAALARSPRRRRVPLLPALSLSGAAFAGLLTFVVFRPEVPPTVVPPAPSISTVVHETQPDVPDVKPTPAPPVQVAKQPSEKQTRPSSAPRMRWNKPRRHKAYRTRRASHARIRPQRTETAVPDRLEYASYQSVSENKPLPADAISLDESPKIVPVVVAEPDHETGGVRLHAAAASVPNNEDAPISLE
jgi:hypothetical protein